MWTSKKCYIFIVFGHIQIFNIFNNLAKKNHTTNIEKSLWIRNFNLQIYHRFNNEKIFSMSFTKNEWIFQIFEKNALHFSFEVLTTSEKNIPYYPCCDISQWTFNKERKTIFILPWKATIYFFNVYKVKGSPILLSERIPELHHYPVKVTVSYESVGENPVTLSRDRWHCKFEMGWTVDSTWQ